MWFAPDTKTARRPGLLIIAAGAALLLAGCSAAAPAGADKPAKQDEVASLTTSGAAPAPAPTSTPGAPADQGRVRIARGMTNAQQALLEEPYRKCMAERNALPDKSGKAGGANPDSKTIEEADKACASKRPLPQWEKDPDNPQFADWTHKMVLCLRKEGVKVRETGPKDAMSYDLSENYKGGASDAVADKVNNASSKCEHEIYGAPLGDG